jgi:hypothetical protein
VTEPGEKGQWSPDQVKDYIDALINTQQAEIDRRIETQRREMSALETGILRIFAERRVTEEKGWQSADVTRQRLEEQIAAVRRELTLVLNLSDKAIEKSEAAYHERFEANNHLIEQMRQQAVAAERALATLTNQFLPRETFEAWRDPVNQQLSQTTGKEAGRMELRDVVIAILLVAVGLAAAISPHIK